jgi:lipoprotein-releasing system permease protein
MALPVELLVGLRYVRSRQAGLFVSFVTWASVGGVALGVAALIVILSVMNGFEDELRDRLLSLESHATLTAPAGPLSDWRTLAAQVAASPGVSGVAPYVESQALLSHGSEMSGATVRGIDPARELSVSSIAPAMVSGSIDELSQGSDRIVLGRVLAFQLGAGVGDQVGVLLPQISPSGELEPRLRSFTVVGVFEVGIQDHDSVLALVNLDDAIALTNAPGVTGLRVRFQDLYAAPRLSQALATQFRLKARDWTEENATYFRAIRLEKLMMTLLLTLAVAVAAFNILAILVMVVRTKRTDIAILRTLGMPPAGVVRTFLTQGVVVGWFGTLLGVLIGVRFALSVPWLQRVLRLQVFDADVFYVTAIPVTVVPRDVIAIAIAAMLLTLAATVYPAIGAARTEPADALRYE